MKQKIVIGILLLLALSVRFYGLDWDQGTYLHPDERLYVNASGLAWPHSLGEFLSRTSPLNPQMFYYGSFPLYLYKVIQVYVLPGASILLTGRLVSAIVSFFTIILLYYLGREIASRKAGLVAALVFAFAVGSIQHAHFITTESMLTFLLTLITLISIRLVKYKNLTLFVPLGILIGLSSATKITGLTFAVQPLLALGFLWWSLPKKGQILIWGLVFVVLAVVSGFLAAPYQIIDAQLFNQQQSYMQGVTYGTYRPVFVIIYEHTLPYLYPLLQVLPFTFGFVSLPAALVGFGVLLKSLIRSFKKQRLILFILLFPFVYYLWAGAWFVKFSRYYILLFPFLALWAGLALTRLSKIYLFPLLFFIALNGLSYVKVYLSPPTRIVASIWLATHAPAGSTIAGEHWDDNLPIGIGSHDFKLVQLPVYDLPDSEVKITSLAAILAQSDYVAFTSRRVYASILANSDKYPLTSRLYREIFAGRLGFKLEQKVTNYPFFVSDDLADETFQSYDHPPVVIFKNQEKLPPDRLSERIMLSVQ